MSSEDYNKLRNGIINEGWSAYQAGKKLTDNKYVRNSMCNWWWRVGWEQAHDKNFEDTYSGDC